MTTILTRPANEVDTEGLRAVNGLHRFGTFAVPAPRRQQEDDEDMRMTVNTGHGMSMSKKEA